jgi:hypothetical protein
MEGAFRAYDQLADPAGSRLPPVGTSDVYRLRVTFFEMSAEERRAE